MAKQIVEGMKVRHTPGGWTSTVVKIEGNRTIYLANGRRYPEQSLTPANEIDPTTLDLIEAIDVYEDGLNDTYGDSSNEPDPTSLIALRRSVRTLLETLDILIPGKENN